MNPSRTVPAWHPLTLIDNYLLARQWTIDERGFWQAPVRVVELYREQLGGITGGRRVHMCLGLDQ